MPILITKRCWLGIILDVDLKRKVAKIYTMKLKTILKGFQFFILILVSMQLQAQNIITYNGNSLDPEKRLITFVDTLQDKIVLSFSPSERCPYWNLPYQMSETTCTTCKQYDFTGINTLSRNDITGLIAINGESIIYNPGWASTDHWCYLSSNNHWIIIYSSIYIYDGYEEWLGFGMHIDIFNSNGTLYRTINSENGEISDIHITDNGKYLIYNLLNVDTYTLGHRNDGYLIVDLSTMETKFDFRDNDNDWISLYSKVFNNYICIMVEPENDQVEGQIQSDGQLICLDMINKIKYTGPVEHDLKYNLKGITEEGILFGIKDVQDSNTILKDFNNFQIGRIR